MSNLTVVTFKIEDFEIPNIIETEEKLFKNDFPEVYSNYYLNWTMTGLYSLGLVSCGVLVMASWYERSGHAGPYRTLLNRLGTLNMEQVIHF